MGSRSRSIRITKQPNFFSFFFLIASFLVVSLFPCPPKLVLFIFSILRNTADAYADADAARFFKNIISTGLHVKLQLEAIAQWVWPTTKYRAHWRRQAGRRNERARVVVVVVLAKVDNSNYRIVIIAELCVFWRCCCLSVCLSVYCTSRRRSTLSITSAASLQTKWPFLQQQQQLAALFQLPLLFSLFSQSNKWGMWLREEERINCD